jgi:phosphatidylglycerol:prolipoprotein diacylglycerol transferase
VFPILHVGDFRFYSFGLLFGAALCLGSYMFLRYFRTHGVAVNPPLLTVILISAGFVGAKLDNAVLLVHYVLHRELFSTGFMYSGYTYLGCVLGGCLAGGLYIHFNRLPWLRTFDSLFCIAPAYALGRVGCFLAGDGDYGSPSTVPWAVSFPHGLVPVFVPVHPTMLYNAAWEMVLFALLVSLDRKRPLPGTLLGLYLVSTAVGRFSIEFWSRNPVLAFGRTEAQLVSAALFLIGSTVLLITRWRSLTGRLTRAAVPVVEGCAAQ